MPGSGENGAKGVLIEDFDVFDLLTSLTDRSLVVSEERDGASRYWLLETVRQYGRYLLMEKEESAGFRKRHLDHFLGFAQEHSARVRGPEQRQALAQLEEEHENLRVALEWGIGDGNSLAGLQLCSALVLFWWRLGHLIEGRSWCLRAAESAAGLARTSERAQVLQGAGILTWTLGDYSGAGPYFEESLEILEEIKDRRHLSFALGGIAMVAFGMDDYVRSRAYGDKAYAVAVESADEWDIAWSGYFIGLLLRIDGDYPGAIARYQESIRIYRKLGDRISLSYPLYDVGLAAYYQGDFPTATKYLEESLQIRQDANDLWGMAESQHGLGLVALGEKDYVKARTHHEASLALAQQIGDVSRHGGSLHWLGCMDLAEGDVTGAEARHKESLALFRELGDRWGLSHCFAGYASLAAHKGDLPRAVTLWSVADALRDQIGSPLPPVERAQRNLDLAEAKERLGDDAAFDRAWEEGLQLTLEQAVELLDPSSQAL